MHRPTILRFITLAAAAVFCVVCLVAVSARSKTPQAQQVSSATPAQNPAPTPAAQDSPPSVDPSAANTAKKSKKIWTNEDVPEMGRPVSVVGDGRDAKNKSAVQKPADPQYVADVRKQLEKLHGQLADADKELAKLKDFNEGEPLGTSDRELHKGYNSQPILQQMANLETKKKDLQSKIDGLLDEARKRGVEPGQLR